MFNRILLAIQFLTILPLSTTMAKEGEYYRIMGWFPLAGLLIGLLTAGLYLGVSHVLPVGVAVLLALMFQFFITGGLHVDGLADTLDGCMSGRSRERKLEIMRDSRLGTHGATAVVFVLLIKTMGYTHSPDLLRFSLLALTPVVGRFALVLGAWRSVYARETGLGNLFIGVIGLRQMGCALMVMLMVLGVEPTTMVGLIPAIALLLLVKKWVSRTLGGMTGDTLGALCEVAEVAFLLGILMMYSGR